MTAARLLASLAFVFTGLLGRALVDKLLAAQGGAVAVAAWAQLASVADVVAGVSLMGIGPALTVLVAGRKTSDWLAWLKPALVLALILSLVVGGAGLGFLLALPTPLLPDAVFLPYLALVSGWLAVGPGLLGALLLGHGRPGRASVLLGLGFLPPLVFILWRPSSSPLLDLVIGQGVFGLAATGILLLVLRRRPPVSRQDLRTLLTFVPAGLAIGILTPACLAWARTEMAANLSWHAVGQVQALWRASDWITAIMAGLLNAHFLPRLGAAADQGEFRRELRHSARAILLPSAVLLTVLWLLLPEAMALLYREDIGVARRDAVFFLLGDWVRIGSWIALIGLFARRAAGAITLGEFFSLPLFALLLFLLPGHFGLKEVGMIWCVTYAAYAAFNGAALWVSLRRS